MTSQELLTRESDAELVSTSENPAVEQVRDRADSTASEPPPTVWKGHAGKLVMIFGVFIPALLVTTYSVACFDRLTLLLLKHPIETFAELALVIMVPLVNLSVWTSIIRDDKRFALRRGILTGVSAGAALGTTAICVAAVCSGGSYIEAARSDYANAFMFIGTLAFGCASASTYLVYRLCRMRELRSSKIRAMGFSVLGIGLSLGTVAAAEVMPFTVRYAEHKATSRVAAERREGLNLLRQLRPLRDLMMEGADPRAAGLSGLFIKADQDGIRRLYFMLTGQPYRDSKQTSVLSMPSSYLREHVVGLPVPGLYLLRSKMSADVHPDTFSSSVSWTFVMDNETGRDEEARAEIALPPGAVLNNVKYWHEGVQKQAEFFPSGDIPGVNQYISVSANEPVVVNDLGRGRVLLHCYPIPAHGQLKVEVSLSAPINASLNSLFAGLPHVIDGNFTISGDHDLTVHSPDAVSLDGTDKRSKLVETNHHVLTHSFTDEQLHSSGLRLSLDSKPTIKPFFVKDAHPGQWNYVVGHVKQKLTPAPKKLVVVLDGSVHLAKHLEDIKAGLKSLPDEIDATLVLAADEFSAVEPTSLKAGLEKLSSEFFAGGQDNLRAVIRGAELAGLSRDGAVLWIHGPQPESSKEIYLMSPYVARPTFFELPVNEGVVDTDSFFKNHEQIGPFTQIEQQRSLKDDLANFVGKWKHGQVESSLALEFTNEYPRNAAYKPDRMTELTALAAKQKVAALIAERKPVEAAWVATSHEILSPVTTAVVLAQHGSGERPGFYTERDGMLALQGGTNGTAVPSVIYGVNTAGTVRVNNLANLEAMLNMLATVFEIIGLLGGGLLVLSGIFDRGTRVESGSRELLMSPFKKVAVGITIGIIALATPALINFFVASARDANLFS